MGLFSKKVTTVGTSFSRVIEDGQLPNSVRKGMIRAIFEEGNIPEYVTEELVQSLGTRVERMYEYARRGEYVHGLPSGQILTSSRGRQEVSTLLQGIHGASVLLDYCHFGPPNSLHFGWIRLIQQYGYNPANNQLSVLTAQKGKPVYLHDLVVMVPEAALAQTEPGVFQQWGMSAKAGYTPLRQFTSGDLGRSIDQTPFEVRGDITQDAVRVEYVWETTETVTEEGLSYTKTVFKTESLVIPIDGVDDNGDYFHVKYTVGSETLPRYWVYQAGSGGYPALDAVFAAPLETAGTFFPFGYFRYNKRSETIDKTTETYRDGRRLMRYFGMDYDTVAEAIDNNPDIGDVEQAMLMMGVPAYSTNPLEQRYLYSFFDTLFYAADEQFLNADQADIWGLFHGGGDTARNALVIQDNRFKMVLSNAGIYKRRIVGNIGAKGSYACATSTAPFSETVQRPSGIEGNVVEEVVTYNVPQHHYRYQVDDFMYDEITVVNLTMAYEVSKNWLTTGDDENPKLLLIPLDHSITQHYTIPDRETLYARAMHFMFNSKVVTKLKWYQTGIFKAIMIIIAIIITVVSAFADGGATLGAALGLTGTAAVVATIVIKLIIGQLISIGFKIIAKTLGADLTILLAITAAVYGAYDAIQAGSIQGAPWATELLQAANGLQNAAMKLMMGDLLAEQSGFEAFMKEQTKLLEDAKKLLEGNNSMDPFIIFGEKPDDFYNRTVHSGNIGVVGINAIGSYVDIALTLPKLNDTI